MKRISANGNKTLLTILFVFLWLPLGAQETTNDLNQQVSKLGQALFYIRQYYIDTVDAKRAVD